MANSSLTSIKRRISSVKSTLKITSAMKVVSTAKLKTYKDKLGQGDLYLSSLNSTLAKIIANLDCSDDDNINSYAQGDKKLIILVTSSLGLCGAYNSNIFKKFASIYKSGDEIIAIGTKSASYLSYRNIEYTKDYVHLFHTFDYSVSRKLGNYIIKRFKTREFGEVVIIGTKFINSLNFKVESKTILPVTNDKEEITNIVIEPDAKTVYNKILPQYINSNLYNILLNSVVCEYASRRNAMDSATNNGEDIIEELTLNYNKARQAAITQEITEVVAGAKGK